MSRTLIARLLQIQPLFLYDHWANSSSAIPQDLILHDLLWKINHCPGDRISTSIQQNANIYFSLKNILFFWMPNNSSCLCSRQYLLYPCRTEIVRKYLPKPKFSQFAFQQKNTFSSPPKLNACHVRKKKLWFFTSFQLHANEMTKHCACATIVLIFSLFSFF